jgi:MFS family permease
LQALRNKLDVSEEMHSLYKQAQENNTAQSMTMMELFRSVEYRWPLITGLLMNVAQQLCGINAVFFYSESIFKASGIVDSQIQYAVFSTGFINVIMTIVCVPLIDRLGRKPLLVFPMILIIVDFILLTVFLNLQV